MITKDEALIISAYTHTILVRDFNDFRLFCEELLDRPISVTEMDTTYFWTEVQKRVEPMFTKLIQSINETAKDLTSPW